MGSIVLLSVSCNNPQVSNQNITQNSDSIKQDNTRVYVDTTEQMAYTRQEEELIRENNNKIAELKLKIKDEKKAIGKNYNEQLDTLNQENTRMETRLNNFKKETKSDWVTFKYNFNKDMDSLGKSISRFAEKNMHHINKETK